VENRKTKKYKSDRPMFLKSIGKPGNPWSFLEKERKATVHGKDLQKRKVFSLELKSENDGILIIISINVSSIATVNFFIVNCFAQLPSFVIMQT